MAKKDASGRRRKLLVIDDDADVQYSYRRVFADADYELISAENGREGIRKFKEEKPDLWAEDIGE